MKKKQLKSKCCKSKVEVHGDAEIVYMVCSKCGKECDVKIQNRWIIKGKDNGQKTK